MSRNLEALEQVQQDRDLFCVAPVAVKQPSYFRTVRMDIPAFDPDGFGREEFVKLAQRLFLAPEGKDSLRARQVVFCGIDEGESTSALCAQFSRILASQVAMPVCIVDANVRVPTMHRLLDVSPSTDQNLLQSRPWRQVAGNLWLIPGHSAATNGGVISTLDQVRSQINELPPEFAYVLINAAPLAICSDAVLLGQKADGVVLVLEANSTRRVAARKAKEALTATNVRVLGTVLNNRTFPIPEKIYRML